MTIRECYEMMGAGYEDVLGRFGSEKLIEKFALKFLNDSSYQELKSALEAKDVETAFRGAHTLKGVCLNLGFDRLYKVSADLTEMLRGGSLEGSEEQFARVEEEYNRTVEALNQLGA